MKPILLLLFAATAACGGALLPLISRARSKRLLLNAVCIYDRESTETPEKHKSINYENVAIPEVHIPKKKP